MTTLYIYLILNLFSSPDMVSNTQLGIEEMENHNLTIVKKVNKLRKQGCKCGRKYMPPVGPIKWNETLYKSALSHAKEMNDYDFFAHYSLDGKDIGERIETFGYKWAVAGENLGEGQKNFDEVLNDWIDSRSHCEMLMNPKVDEMGVANYGRFWVQHFGKEIPKGSTPTSRY